MSCTACSGYPSSTIPSKPWTGIHCDNLAHVLAGEAGVFAVAGHALCASAEAKERGDFVATTHTRECMLIPLHYCAVNKTMEMQMLKTDYLLQVEQWDILTVL